MTQDNDSATGSGNAPEAAAPAKKTRATTKKTTPAKSAAKKPATEKKPSAEPAVPAAEDKKPASKPRAAAKTTAKKTTAGTRASAAKSTGTAKSAPESAETVTATGAAAKKTPAKPRKAVTPKTASVPEEKTAAKQESAPAEAPAKQVPADSTAVDNAHAEKPATKARAAAKTAKKPTAKTAKTTAKKTAADTKASTVKSVETAAPAPEPATAPAEKTETVAPARKQEPDARKAETPAASDAKTKTAAPAAKKQSRAPRAPRSKTAAKQAPSAAETLTDKSSQPAPDAASASSSAAVPVRPEAPRAIPQEVSQTVSPVVPQTPPQADSQTAGTSRQETPQQDAALTAEGHTEGEAVHTASADAPELAGQPSSGKPASRRSRRGGRRRNKAKAAAAAAERENGTASVEADGAAESPAAMEAKSGKPQDAHKTRDTDAKAAGKDSSRKPGDKNDKGGKDGKKDVAKQDQKQAVKPESTQETAAEEPETISGGKRKMFISVLSGELVEVVLAEEGQVVEYYVEMQHQAKVKGNIYKGVVSNIDANLQAAFISYAGGVKNGFLQIDEVHPEYYLAHHDAAKGRKYPPIQKVLKPGQEILVQVVKEPAGTKGAFLTSYLSLPGRFLVLTPGREQIGVSRKVDNDEERGRLRAMLEGLKPGPGLGVIVRTVSTGASKTSMQRDLQFLKRLWKDVRTKGQTAPAPSLIYEELDLSTRAVRDYLTEEVLEVWVDDAATAAQVTELATLLFPKKKDMVQVHHDSGQSLFERFSLQKQLDQIHSREVSLPSGGSLVIDKTEALTAIDINSGRSSGKSNFEDMAYRTNLEAARAIPLQLRLRDIGGQIVADFIEMRDRDHWREVEKAVRAGMKGDRARYDVGKIGPFGMLEIVRQRLGSSAISISTEPCPCCKGTGIRRNMEWQAMQSLREIGRKLRQAGANNQPTLTWNAEPELAFYLLNAKRALLQNLESESGVSLVIAPKTA